MTRHYTFKEDIPIKDKFLIDGHKAHYHVDKLYQLLHADKQQVFPIYVEISPVGHCNHRCTFCAVDYIGYKNRSIASEVLKRNLTDMAGHDVRSVMYAGEGEPLLHPQLGEIINHTKSVGIDVAITTNGVALTDKLVVQSLHNISWIKVSMNGGPGSYQKVHKAREKDYELVWANLKRAVEWRDINHFNTVIGLQSVLLPENMEDMHGLASRARDTGLDYFVVKPYSQHHSSITQEYKNVRYTTDNIRILLRELEEYNSDEFEVVAREKSMASWDSSARGYTKCMSTPMLWAYVMSSGDVYGCSAYLLDDRFKYGNINERLFSEVWLGKERKSCIDYVDNELDISECRKNCRMHKVNQYLWDLKNPTSHKNFI